MWAHTPARNEELEAELAKQKTKHDVMQCHTELKVAQSHTELKVAQDTDLETSAGSSQTVSDGDSSVQSDEYLASMLEEVLLERAPPATATPLEPSSGGKASVELLSGVVAELLFGTASAPQQDTKPSQLAPRTKLSGSAALFVPKRGVAPDDTELSSIAPRFAPGWIGTPPDDGRTAVGAAMEWAFGDHLVGLRVCDIGGNVEVHVDVPPPLCAGTVQCAREVLVEHVANVLKKTFGPRALSLEVAEDLSAIFLQLLPTDPVHVCWDYVRYGCCPRSSCGQRCRWSHMISTKFALMLNILGTTVDAPSSPKAPESPQPTPAVNGEQECAVPGPRSSRPSTSQQQDALVVVQPPPGTSESVTLPLPGPEACSSPAEPFRKKPSVKWADMVDDEDEEMVWTPRF